jgi:hypothetical protein
MISYFLLFLNAVLLAATGMKCPDSPAFMHAGCQISVTFENSCDSVRTEVISRVDGQYDAWHDPHNNGTYTITMKSLEEIDLERLTGDKKYTDKIIFTFTDTGPSSCSVDACSQSQVTSILDFSTNYCNMHDLYCSDEGCHPLTKLSYVEKTSKCTQSDASSCLVI